MQNKFWLTLITQNREKDIDELTRDTHKLFSGIVAVVNQPSNDKTFDILESRKGEGKIIKRDFVKNHGFLMNEFLFSGVIKTNDWFMICDSSDRIRLNWLKRLVDGDLDHFNKVGIGGVVLDRLYLAKFYDSEEFFGGVHWGLKGLRGKIVNYSQINGYRKENCIINTRGLKPEVAAVEHPIKYFVEYGSDSQTQLLYQQFSNECWQWHENLRMQFRVYCEKELGLELKVGVLVEYLKEGIKNKNLPDFVINAIQTEVNLQDLVRYYILGQKLEELASNRFNWDFKKFYNEGIEHQNKNDDYIGPFNRYRLQKGLEQE